MSNNKIHQTYTAVPVPENGMITVEDLKRIIVAARQFEPPMMEITGGQHIAFLAMQPESPKLAML